MPFHGGVVTGNGSCCARSPGGAVAQRLRGYKWRSEKSVKAIAPTGAALAFCASTSSLGLSRASSPWPVAGGWSPEVGRGESEHPSLPLAQRSVSARCWQAESLPIAHHFQSFFPQTFWKMWKNRAAGVSFAQKRGKINCKIRKCALRQVCRAGRTSIAHP